MSKNISTHLRYFCPRILNIFVLSSLESLSFLSIGRLLQEIFYTSDYLSFTGLQEIRDLKRMLFYNYKFIIISRQQ